MIDVSNCVFDNCVDEFKVDFLNVSKMIETVAPLRGSYDPWRMGTSVAIAVLADFTALSVSSHMVAAASWASGVCLDPRDPRERSCAPGHQPQPTQPGATISRRRSHGIGAMYYRVQSAKPLVDALEDDLTAAIRGLQALIGVLHAA